MWKKTTAPVASIDYLTEPMGLDELRYFADRSETGEVEATVGVYLDEVANGDYEDFLDLVTERVCGGKALLSDISTSVVGVDTDNGKVLVKVSGSLEEFDADYDWDDED